MELTNLYGLKKEHLKDAENLTKQDKRELFKIWLAARKENREKIISSIQENVFIESEMEGKVLICKGEGDSKQFDACVNIKINDFGISLIEDFILRVGSHSIVIYFKDSPIFEMEIEKITSFYIGWG